VDTRSSIGRACPASSVLVFLIPRYRNPNCIRREASAIAPRLWVALCKPLASRLLEFADVISSIYRYTMPPLISSSGLSERSPMIEALNQEHCPREHKAL
jgi:hypothetical protein